MTDWLHILSMIFYAPLRGMREARDHGTLGPAVVCAYVIQVGYVFVVQFLAGDRSMLKLGPAGIINALFHSVAPILTVAVIVVPVLTLIANLFDRRGSFSVVLQQEYGPLASVSFYALSAASAGALLVAIFLHFSVIHAA